MPNAALIPRSKIENDFYNWFGRHDAKCAAARAKNHDLIFIGDSITHFFEGHPGCADRGDEVWRETYGKRNALNLGFGWDRTCNVLWRLQHGEFFGQTPKLVVLNIGTNNLTPTPNYPGNTPAEIVEGILAVCDEILKLSPKTHVLVMALFPREKPGHELRKGVEAVNEGLRKAIPSRKGCELLDIGPLLLDKQGELLYMPDSVHPATAGYRVWAKALEPHVKRRLKKA